MSSDLPVEDFFSAGGFLFGAAAGYTIKKVMKIAAVVIGLFVAGTAYLSYRIDVKWTATEDVTRSALANVTAQAIHTLCNAFYGISFRITHSSRHRICTWTSDWI